MSNQSTATFEGVDTYVQIKPLTQPQWHTKSHPSVTEPLQAQNTIAMESRFSEAYNLIHSVLMYDSFFPAVVHHLDHRAVKVLRITDNCITINQDLFLGKSIYISIPQFRADIWYSISLSLSLSQTPPPHFTHTYFPRTHFEAKG